MGKHGLSVPAIPTIAITLACGSSPRTLQSDAQGSPTQFTATGYFNKQPSPVRLSVANWGVCYQNQPTSAVSVSADGLARCAAGAVGTYTVWAWSERGGDSCGSADLPLPLNPCGGAGECQVTGTAQLTGP